jgi:osmotically-inducible protein OsmY
MTKAIWRSIAVALALGLAAGSGAACSSTRTAGTRIDDAVVTTKVKSKLAADPQVSAMNVSVDTNDGVVTLTGRVEDETARREAVKLAKDTEGVVSVRDLLEVGEPE